MRDHERLVHFLCHGYPLCGADYLLPMTTEDPLLVECPECLKELKGSKLRYKSRVRHLGSGSIALCGFPNVGPAEGNGKDCKNCLRVQKSRVLTPSDPRILAWKELSSREHNIVFGVLDESRENFVLNGGISISDWLGVAQKALEALNENI